jgi:NifU-like domain
MIDEDRLKQRMQRIAGLVRQLDTEADARAARAQSRELVEAVMDLHGEALERILQRLRGAGAVGEELLDSLAADPLVASVLLLYGQHPQDFDTRVRRAIEKARSALRSYGTGVELIGTTGGAIRIRIRGADNAFTARTVRSAVEEEIYAMAPDAVSLTLIGLEKFAPPDFVPLEKVTALAAAKADTESF